MNNIFIVCGGGCNEGFLQPVADKMKDSFRCHVHAPTGFTEDVMLSNLKNDLVLFNSLREEGSRTFILAHCLGGALAIKLLADNPQLEIAGLILINSAPGYYFMTPESLQASGESIESYADFPEVQQILLNCREVDKMQPQSALAMTLDYREEAKKCPVPTLQIAGDCDGMIPNSVTEEFDACLPNNVLKIVTGGRHFFVLTNLDFVCELVTSWIDTMTSPSKAQKYKII